MPFLRFSRDKRGYETTAVLHAFRRGGRAQPRILYWFRTPVDVRVGRTALDEEAIRLLEAHHRTLSFDWQKILEVAPAVEAAAPGDRRARSGDLRKGERRRRRREEAAPPPPSDAALPVPETGAEIDAVAAAESAGRSAFSPEDLARLRGRHAAVLARIDQEVTDHERAEALRGQADALDPDTWVTADEVRQALERYEQVYRDLREALGPRRRRQPNRTGGDHEPPQVV